MVAVTDPNVRELCHCRCGDTVYAVGSVEDYPYDKNADAYGISGLDLLRTMEDRRTAVEQFELYWCTEHRQECRLERSTFNSTQHWRDTMNRLRGLAEGARDGADGQPGVELFRRMLKQDGGFTNDYTTLRAFEKALEIMRRTNR